MPRINGWEWRHAIVLALILVLLSYVPFYVGFHHAPAGLEFEGFFINGVDGNTYLAAMQQGLQGHWLFRLLYTSEDHQGSLIYVFYVGLGHLAGLLGASLVGMYHGVRLLAGFGLLMAEYAFIASLVPAAATRWVAYVLASCASGLGWLILLVARSTVVGGLTPIDFWLADAYTFFAIMHAPHFCLALACLLLLFMFILAFFRTGRPRTFVGAGLSALGVALFDPYILLLAGGILGAYWLLVGVRRRALPWRETLGLIGLALILALPMAAYKFVLGSDPVWQGFAGQDLSRSPTLIFLLLGYGLSVIFMVLGALRIVRRNDEIALFLVVWGVLACVAFYLPFNWLLPFNPQRRMVKGLQVPVGILAAVGLVRYVLPAVRRSRLAAWLQRHTSYRPQRFRLLVLNLIIVMALPSNLYLWLSMVASARLGHPDLFRPAAEVAVIDWLGAYSRPDDTVLSSYRTGNYIPARIGHRVFLGHWDETIDYSLKNERVAAFFRADTSDAARRNLLLEYRIAYVFWGPFERKLGGFQPDSAPYLSRAFGNETAVVYRVVVS